MSRAARVAALTAVAFALRLAALWTDEPVGTDGYYYVVQIQDLVATGALHVPDGSWVLRALAVPHALGAGPIASLAIVAAALAAAVVPAAAWAWPDRWSPAVLLAASPTLAHLAADFPKALGAAAPLLVFVGALHRRWWGTAVVAGGLAATAHRLGAAFVLLAAVGAAASHLDRRAWRALAAIGVAAVAFAAVASAVPGWLHPADLERLDGQLRLTPWPPAPLVWPRSLPGVERAELLAAYAALAWVPSGLGADRTRTAALAAALAAAMFPWWRSDILDIGYRLMLFAPLFAAPLIRVPDARALCLLLPAAPFGVDRTAAPPYAMWREVLDAVPEPLPDLLITPPGMSFLYDHRTGREAMAWAPEPHLDRSRIGRVVFGVRPGEWALILQPDHPPVVPLPHGYSYVREDVWEALVAAADADDTLHEWATHPNNPTRVRPASLVRGR